MSTKWLNEIVCWNHVEYIPRYTAIWRFVSKGLYPFIISRGYVFNTDVQSLTSNIATLLYRNKGLSCLDSKVAPPPLLKEYNEEYKSHYYHVFGPTEWDSFWLQWDLWSDVADSTNRGNDRRLDIQEYCWSQLDLEESPQTRVVDELLCISEDVQYTARTEDVYLRESAESNEWGGYR